MSSGAVPRPAAAGRWARFQDLILPVAMVASILVILAPVPASLMDLLLAANITIAVIMLLTTLYVRTPLEFNVFPSLLLATTLFRLVLNVATTRLILTRAAADGQWAAGGVVWTFGRFVTGGATGTDNIVVGLVIFSIIVLIQFVVITKGATRISEVAARFTLDGMPGKQMAIDADLGAGVIDQHEAQRRRREKSPSRPTFLVRWTGPASSCAATPSRALLLSLSISSAGWSSASSEHGMSLEPGRFVVYDADDRRRVGHTGAGPVDLAGRRHVDDPEQPREQSAERIFAAAFPAAPGVGHCRRILWPCSSSQACPKIPLLLYRRGACGAMALTLSRRENKSAVHARTKKQSRGVTPARPRTGRGLLWPSIRWNWSLASGLLHVADPQTRRRSAGTHRNAVRQNLAAELGVVLPKVRVRDNMRLEPTQYRVKIADMVVAQSAIDTKDARSRRTRLPRHLTETARRHADELLTRDSVKHLVDELRRRTSPAAVDELMPEPDETGRPSARAANAIARGRFDSAVGPDFRDPGRPSPHALQ